MYLFQISNYDDPAVDRETAELLHRHLEAESRRRCPAMWNAIDRIRTHAAKGPARERRTVRYRIYGVFLLALGLLTLILGLMPPRATDVIIVGGAVIIAGLLEFALARGRTPPRIPASCKKEARKALELRRAVDWEKLKTAIRFEDAGITICAEENEEHQFLVPFGQENIHSSLQGFLCILGVLSLREFQYAKNQLTGKRFFRFLF